MPSVLARSRNAQRRAPPTYLVTQGPCWDRSRRHLSTAISFMSTRERFPRHRRKFDERRPDALRRCVFIRNPSSRPVTRRSKLESPENFQRVVLMEMGKPNRILAGERGSLGADSAQKNCELFFEVSNAFELAPLEAGFPRPCQSNTTGRRSLDLTILAHT